MKLTAEQQRLDEKLWWTTVRPWLAEMGSWPTQPAERRRHGKPKQSLNDYLNWLENTPRPETAPTSRVESPRRVAVSARHF
jgi:hypothetical protein